LLRGRERGRPQRVCFASKKAKENKAMQFQKGQSGNPAGRPRGARNRTTILMQNLLAEHAEAIGRKVTALAKNGDIAAIRICMDRLAPARKDEPVAVELPPIETAADGVAAAATIVAAVAAGDLTASEAADLAKVVDIYVRALETKGFDERLTKLENRPPRLPLDHDNCI
jgi:hypothetical protein